MTSVRETNNNGSSRSLTNRKEQKIIAQQFSSHVNLVFGYMTNGQKKLIATQFAKNIWLHKMYY